jgi:hypothetical protein
LHQAPTDDGTAAEKDSTEFQAAADPVPVGTIDNTDNNNVMVVGPDVPQFSLPVQKPLEQGILALTPSWNDPAATNNLEYGRLDDMPFSLSEMVQATPTILPGLVWDGTNAKTNWLDGLGQASVDVKEAGRHDFLAGLQSPEADETALTNEAALDTFFGLSGETGWQGQ